VGLTHPERPESATEWLRRVGPDVKRANADSRREDARELRRRLRKAEDEAASLYETIRSIAIDLEQDGHDERAVFRCHTAALRLKQAEAELLYAYEFTKTR